MTEGPAQFLHGRRVKCDLTFGSYSMWIRHIVSGFFDLYRSGAIQLSVSVDEPRLGSAPLVEATIDARTRVVYDGHDGYNFLFGVEDPWRRFDEMLDECDLWFKYTCVESKHRQLHNRDKVRALGLTSAYFGSRHNPYDVGLLPPNPHQLLSTIIGTSAFLSAMTSRNSRHMWPDQYEAGPTPGVENEEVRRERATLNEFRVGVIHEGRRRLGDLFVGGLQRDEYSSRRYPDCVYDGAEAANRFAYLKTMKRASIGISSAGLHGCAGGKLGEYVAASRAVVTTALPMTLPGEFVAGVNYFEAATPTGIIDACTSLLADPHGLSAMMRANHEYYNAYVRPSASVSRTIREALGNAGDPLATHEGLGRGDG
jgi:hypothetical protein